MKQTSTLLSKDQMEKLTTKRLLAYKAKLLSYPETPDWDRNSSISKEDDVWQEAYDNIKNILSTREHIEKK